MASTTEGASTFAQEVLLTEEERAELEHAKTMPIVFDENCPETTPGTCFAL